MLQYVIYAVSFAIFYNVNGNESYHFNSNCGKKQNILSAVGRYWHNCCTFVAEKELLYNNNIRSLWQTA